MTTSIPFRFAGATAAALALSLATVSCAPEEPPNIILVSVDTLRWDFLNTYGYPEPDFTPAVTRLAENGMVFENAVATAGTTVPSHGSMLTGLYPRLHGARSNLHNRYDGAHTVTEALRQSGYRTGAFLSAGFLVKRGLGEGFETDNITRRDGSSKADVHDGESTVSQAIEWLDSLDAAPFFMWLHLWEPHGPYDATDWSRDKLAGYDGFLKDGVSMQMLKKRAADILGTPEHLEAVHTHYAGEVNLADRHLETLLDALERSGELDNTLVIFTADHGQGLGTESTLGHGPTHIETVVRVPMIVADFRSGRAGRSQTRVSVVDVAPTIADAAGLDNRFDYAGRSILEESELTDDWPYFVEVALRTSEHRNWDRIEQSGKYDPNAVAVYSGPMKMTVKNGLHQLFETRSDWIVAREVSLESEPVIADYLTGLIETFRENTLDLSSDDISEEELKVLRGLGYVQ